MKNKQGKIHTVHTKCKVYVSTIDLARIAKKLLYNKWLCTVDNKKELQSEHVSGAIEPWSYTRTKKEAQVKYSVVKMAKVRKDVGSTNFQIFPILQRGCVRVIVDFSYPVKRSSFVPIMSRGKAMKIPSRFC